MEDGDDGCFLNPPKDLPILPPKDLSCIVIMKLPKRETSPEPWDKLQMGFKSIKRTTR